MRRAVVFVLVAPTLLAGCADLLPGGQSCQPPYPLVLQAHPQVTNASNYQFHSVFWNCTRQAVAVDDPCDLRNGVMPKLTIDGADYYLGVWSNGTAKPADALWCDPVTPARTEVPPGAWVDQQYLWNGTYLPEGADEARAVPPGTYIVSVRAGTFYASEAVRVPW